MAGDVGVAYGQDPVDGRVFLVRTLDVAQAVAVRPEAGAEVDSVEDAVVIGDVSDACRGIVA